jgi:hypothetical protein
MQLRTFLIVSSSGCARVSVSGLREIPLDKANING